MPVPPSRYNMPPNVFTGMMATNYGFTVGLGSKEAPPAQPELAGLCLKGFGPLVRQC